jgi:biopolymer transport protein ExbD
MRATWCVVMAVALVVGCGNRTVKTIVHEFYKSGPKKRSYEQIVKDDATPPALVADALWSAPVRTVTIRVWADDEYRAQHMHWRRSFQEQLDYANEVLVALLGVRLEPDYREWNRRAGPEVRLEDSLDALKAQDRASDGVFAVVGLTSSLSLVSRSYEKLGVAFRGEPWMMLRGHSDREERAQFEKIFIKMDEDERERLYTLRRRHKIATTILHELGHTLGIGHNRDNHLMMSSHYSVKTAAFHADDRVTMLAAIERRISGPQVAPVAFDDADAGAATDATLVIELVADDSYTVKGAKLNTKQLDELLRRQVIATPDMVVEIVSDATLPPELVSNLMSRVYAVGFVQVSISIPERDAP